MNTCVKKRKMLQPVEFEGNNDNNVTGLSRKRKLERVTGCLENNRPFQSNVQCAGGGSLAVGCQDNFGERNRVHGDGDVTIGKETGKETGVVVGKSGHSLAEMSPKTGGSYVNVVVEGGRRNGSSVDEIKSHVGKLASIVAEKLWDGSLQLNSSVTVSLVAFFQSGEKMPDLKWSEFLEVKGKVRLEAFEKYVQDLPRSRNRGLMVISLRCKEGSSKSGLAGMKEVAKGYKKGKRVGFVQVSQGIDLYVCPRSDSIITILAKHGFFKGMAAVEDNQDSLIGCVVWRRKQASSSSVLEKSARKHGSLSEQPLKSPSDSSVERADHKALSCCIQVGSRTDCTTLDGDENNNVEHKDNETKQVQTELRITSSTIDNLLLTSTILSNSPSMSNGLQTSSTHDSASYLPAMGKLLQVGPLVMNNSEEKPKTSELRKHGSQLSTDIAKKPLRAPYDDDLPEFDFGTACGLLQTPTSKPLHGAIADNKLPAEELKKILESLPQITPTVQSMLVSNQRELRDFNPPRLPLDTLLKMPVQRKICVDGMNVLLPNLEEKWMPVTTTSARPLKNLFDDDDDMPEWSPPDVELLRQHVSDTIRPSTTSTYSKVRNLIFERLPPGCPNNLLSSSPRSAYAPFTPQAGISASHQLMSHNGRPSQPSLSSHALHGPNSSTVFNPNPLPLSRPPRDPFDAKLPVHHGGWNRRRC